MVPFYNILRVFKIHKFNLKNISYPEKYELEKTINNRLLIDYDNNMKIMIPKSSSFMKNLRSKLIIKYNFT